MNKLIAYFEKFWRNISLYLFALLSVLFLASCIFIPDITPHENFKDYMARNVGRAIDDPRAVGSVAFVKSKTLSNGNIENEYKWRGTCREFFEFDPQTRIIVDWRFTGSEKDCSIPH